MKRPVTRYTHTNRGAVPLALQIVLVVILLIGATAVGLFVVGPWWTATRTRAQSPDTNTANVDSGSHIARDSAGGTEHPKDATGPQMVSSDNELASIKIGERPRPTGSIIRRTDTPPGGADLGGVKPEAPTVPDGEVGAPAPTTKTDTHKKPATNPGAGGTPTVKGPPTGKDVTKTKPTPPTTVDTTVAGPPGPLYRVRVGICSERSNAEDLLAQLRTKGYGQTSLVTYTKGGRTFYGVQTGAFAKKENAESVKAKLRNDGWDSTVISDER